MPMWESVGGLSHRSASRILIAERLGVRVHRWGQGGGATILPKPCYSVGYK